MLLHDDNDRLRAGVLDSDPEAGTVPLGPDGEPWSPLAPLDAYRAREPFPVNVLPPWLGEVVEGYATQFQVPADLPGLLAFPVLATAAPRVKLQVRRGWDENHLGVFATVVLPSGEGKSPVFSAMQRPLVEWERGLRKELAPEIERRKAAAAFARKRLQAAMNKQGKGGVGLESIQELALEANQAEAAVPVHPRFFTADCTPEKLAQMMAEHGGRMTVLSDEAGIFEIMAGRYSKSGSANLDVFLQGYTGSPVRVDRIQRGSISIDNPMLSIGLTVQPSVLRSLGASADFRGRGLLARFLWGVPVSMVGFRDLDAPAIRAGVEGEYQRRLTALLRLRREQGDRDAEGLRLSPDGWAILNSLRGEIEPRLAEGSGDLHWLSDWANKLPGALARVAGLLHLAQTPDPRESSEVSGETVSAAVRLAPYLIDHARAAFGAMGQDPAIASAQRLLPYIAGLSRERFSVRDLHQQARGRAEFARAPSVKAALAVLAQLDYVRPVEATAPSGPGRPPSEVYAVNPLWAPQNPHNPRNPGI